MQLPPRYHEIIWPMIEKAKGFLEKGEKLSPLAFVGNFETGQTVPILINTLDDSRKDASAVAIRLAAESMAADYIFTVIEGWDLPKYKMLKYKEIIERYGSIGASPYRIDTANFMLETRYGVWGAQVPLKFKAPPRGGAPSRHPSRSFSWMAPKEGSLDCSRQSMKAEPTFIDPTGIFHVTPMFRPNRQNAHRANSHAAFRIFFLRKSYTDPT